MNRRSPQAHELPAKRRRENWKGVGVSCGHFHRHHRRPLPYFLLGSIESRREPNLRWKEQAARLSSSPAQPYTSPSLIRNIGVCAHVDAGKTTLTERMLFLAGEGRHQGSVDDGDTVTDFLEQERERGITIQSAAVSLRWAGHNITLIDTPGHVDFGVEVERALRVMDGVVVVIDAVAGVQAQTEAVWRTAQAQGIPAMAFINKLDRQGADMHGAMASVQHRLGIFPLPIHMPLGSSQGSEYGLCGLVDLVSMEPLIYSTGVRGGAVNSANRDSVVLERPGWDAACATLEPGARDSAEEWRGKLLANLAEVDDTFMEMYLLRGEGDGSYSTDEILVALRRACFSRAGIPVACGAALRGVGVESLLDCVLTFLPGPLERPSPTGILRTPSLKQQMHHKRSKPLRRHRRNPSALSEGEPSEDVVTTVEPESAHLSALAFKVVQDKRRGPLVFLRVYSGQMQAKEDILNTASGEIERPLQLLHVHADQYTMVEVAGPGQIVAAVGLSKTFTGDTLVRPKGPLVGLHLSGVRIPEPVFSVAVETATATQQKALEDAMDILLREDPSLHMEEDEGSGQIVLKGVGELHLQIVCDRLQREFRIPVNWGRPRVAYREAITTSAEISEDYERGGAGGAPRLFAGFRLRADSLAPAALGTDGPIAGQTCAVELDPSASQQMSHVEQAELYQGIMDALERGPLGGFPMNGVRLLVLEVRRDADTTPGALRFAGAHLARKIMTKAGAVLLEPMMKAEIYVPDSGVGAVLNDLTAHRRASIKRVAASVKFGGPTEALPRSTIHADIPLRELVGYASTLRSITAGEASLSMELHGYREVETGRTAILLAEE